MNRRTKQIGVALGVLAIAGFALWRPITTWLGIQAASSALQERTRLLVEKNQQLQADWDLAMQDKVLTWTEAKEIVEKSGEKLGPNEE